ncbi:hypothetical protein PmNV_063 [Penaeus monodon nudivirus]|uniref:Uncharacterized protein n=2 Tax=Lefavirales TaxID=2840070 RepID=A0A076FIZ6_9VIRU|nr:hypothetical protein PmNV_063 [Penaeus monodon nudivirus]ABX44708.1 hypothetical protein [Penaeus monodon nucleopolyhedrovirus]AII15851.1 hypothetical protein PmNV_063 [Penaeus monodon nudivirus]
MTSSGKKVNVSKSKPGNKGVLTKYILKKLCQHQFIKDNFSEDDVKLLKRLVAIYIPKKITSSDEVQEAIELIVDEIIKQKSMFLQYAIERMKEEIHKKVIAVIDKIIKRYYKKINDKN